MENKHEKKVDVQGTFHNATWTPAKEELNLGEGLTHLLTKLSEKVIVMGDTGIPAPKSKPKS
jgi:hypothetical protein